MFTFSSNPNSRRPRTRPPGKDEVEVHFYSRGQFTGTKLGKIEGGKVLVRYGGSLEEATQEDGGWRFDMPDNTGHHARARQIAQIHDEEID